MGGAFLTLAINTVKTVWKDFQILVTPADGPRAKYNLKKVSS